MNSLTNLAFVYLAYRGISNCVRNGHDTVFLVGFISYLIIGLGSFLFHSSLNCMYFRDHFFREILMPCRWHAAIRRAFHDLHHMRYVLCHIFPSTLRKGPHSSLPLLFSSRSSLLATTIISKTLCSTRMHLLCSPPLSSSEISTVWK